MTLRIKFYSRLLALLFLLPGCTDHPHASDYPRVATYALQDTAGTSLGRAYAAAIKKHPGQSGFHLLASGPASLMMRIALVQAAERSIDIQYFSTEDDKTGKLLLEAVIRAANRGVRVRMLIDDWNIDGFEAGAAALNANAHIELRVFNPYATRDQSIFARLGNVFSLAHYLKRMHNKAIIVDNQAAIMGGRNLGDEYFDAGENLNFSDVDIFAVGPVVRRISENFDRYWNSNEAFPLEAVAMPSPDAKAIAYLQGMMKEHWKAMLNSRVGRRLEALPLPHKADKGKVPLIWAKAEFRADKPSKVNRDSDHNVSIPARSIADLVDDAQHEFVVFTPYLVPLDKGVDWLDSLVARGVRVRIVTNSLASTDMVPAEAGYSHYREGLVKGGVELYEVKSSVPPAGGESMFKPSSQNGLHAKVYMIDRRDLVIGSFNLDSRSVHLNTEQVLVIHSPALCSQVAKLFSTITSLKASYRVMPASAVPASRLPLIHGPLVWMTEEKGKIVYYDFSPHAGFWRNVTDWLFSLLPIDEQL